MTRISRGLGAAATLWTLALSGSANALVLQFDVSSTNISGSFDVQYVFDTSDLLSSNITDPEHFQQTFGLVSATLIANGTTYHSSTGDMFFQSGTDLFGDIVAGRAYFDTPFGDVNVPDALTWGMSNLGSTDTVFDLDDVPFVPDPSDFSNHVFALIVDDIVSPGSVFDTEALISASEVVTAVPTPGSIPLLISGLAGMLAFRSRWAGRSKSRSPLQ